MSERRDFDRPLTARTRHVLRRYGIKPKRSLGQNFLTDAHVLDKMMAAADIDPSTGVLEVGPGIGSLTERLAEAAGSVVAVEIDQRLVPVLEDIFANDAHVFIQHGDVLVIELEKLMRTYFKDFERTVVVANLPYYITSPVLLRLLQLQWSFERLVLMTQKEVAERLTAKPGSKSYGWLTVAVHYYTSPEIVARVPTHVFIPRPQVDSAVIRLTPHLTPPVDAGNREQFFQVVQASFKERRKTLTNNLKAHLLRSWDKARIREWLTQLDIDPSRRAETLSLHEFARMSRAYFHSHR